MAVLIELFNVIGKLSSIESKYLGGLANYINDCPTETYCQDIFICRIGFGDYDGTYKWADELFSKGLDEERNGIFQDLTFVDGYKGLAAQCDWLEFNRDENGSMWAYLRGTEIGDKVAHQGWKPGQVFWLDADDVIHRDSIQGKKWWKVWR